jgi:hypothetical protein
MIEATYKTMRGNLLLKVSGETVKAVFKEIAHVAEVFDADTECGLCHSTDLRYRTRTIDGNDYFELSCLSCGGALKFGQHKTGGTLFANRGEGENGWTRFLRLPEGEA